MKPTTISQSSTVPNGCSATVSSAPVLSGLLATAPAAEGDLQGQEPDQPVQDATAGHAEPGQPVQRLTVRRSARGAFLPERYS